MGLGKHLRAGPPATLRRGCGGQRAGHTAVFKETSHAHWIRLRGAALLTEDGRGLPPGLMRHQHDKTETTRRMHAGAGCQAWRPDQGPAPTRC